MLTLKHKKLTSITSTNHSYIEWHLTYACPFKCWYCPEDVWNGPLLARYDWEVYSDFLDEVLERYKKGYFLLSGGEPTNWPYFTNILDKFHNNPNWEVMTLTNLSRSKDFIDQWVHKTDWIVTSFHPNVIKTQAQRDKWFEKALSYKKKTSLNIKILMDPLHWNYCLDKFNSLNDEDISLTPIRIHNVAEATRPETYIHYTSEQEKILSNLKAKIGNNLTKEDSPIIPERKTTLKYDDGEEQTSVGAFDAWHITSQIMRHDRNKFKGWLCNMGMDNLFIDEKGNIARGICASGNHFVGHLNNLSKVRWPTTPTICPKTYCYCEGEVGITKRKLKPAEIKLLRDKIKRRSHPY
jgi:organic radical activating enzyme